MRWPAVPVLSGVSLLLLPGVAMALWSSTAEGSAQAAALTMTNATGFAAACTSKSTTISLSWTPTTDPDVDRYVITRTGSGGGTSRTWTVTDRTTTGTTDSVTAPSGQTVHSYTYSIQAGAAAHTWTSPALAAPQTITVSNKGCP